MSKVLDWLQKVIKDAESVRDPLLKGSNFLFDRIGNLDSLLEMIPVVGETISIPVDVAEMLRYPFNLGLSAGSYVGSALGHGLVDLVPTSNILEDASKTQEILRNSPTLGYLVKEVSKGSKLNEMFKKLPNWAQNEVRRVYRDNAPLIRYIREENQYAK